MRRPVLANAERAGAACAASHAHATGRISGPFFIH